MIYPTAVINPKAELDHSHPIGISVKAKKVVGMAL
jgi:hypothetical protein